MQFRKHGLSLALWAALSASLGAAQAATIYTGDVIQGKRVVSDGTDPKCDGDGDGCVEENADYTE